MEGEPSFSAEGDAGQNPRPPRLCPVCGYACRSRSNYYSHLRTHREPAHVCDECGKAFPTATRLRRHATTHTGERPFRCTHAHCDRAFTTRQYLEKHLATHKTKQTFCCTKEGCGAAFFIKSELVAHVREAHPEAAAPRNGAFCCPYEGCPRAFEFPCQLYRHCVAQHPRATHVCGFDACYATFASEAGLRAHVVAAHGWSAEAYDRESTTCPECGVAVLARTLERHLRNAHGDRPVVVRGDGTLGFGT